MSPTATLPTASARQRKRKDAQHTNNQPTVLLVKKKESAKVQVCADFTCSGENPGRAFRASICPVLSAVANSPHSFCWEFVLCLFYFFSFFRSTPRPRFCHHHHRRHRGCRLFMNHCLFEFLSPVAKAGGQKLSVDWWLKDASAFTASGHSGGWPVVEVKETWYPFMQKDNETSNTLFRRGSDGHTDHRTQRF